MKFISTLMKATFQTLLSDSTTEVKTLLTLNPKP